MYVWQGECTLQCVSGDVCSRVCVCEWVWVCVCERVSFNLLMVLPGIQIAVKLLQIEEIISNVTSETEVVVGPRIVWHHITVLYPNGFLALFA